MNHEQVVLHDVRDFYFSEEGLEKLVGLLTGGRRKQRDYGHILKQAQYNPLFRLVIAVDKTRSRGDDHIGMGAIFFQRNLSRWIGEIHDVVVDENYRGKGIAESIVMRLIDLAVCLSHKEKDEVTLYLTSRPYRIAANKLYEKIGFKLVADAHGEQGTNLYKMVIDQPHF